MTEPASDAGQQRLQKILAAAGVASRRKAEELITGGRVQVNGQAVTELGTKADPARDHIRVDGKLLHGAERLRYFVMNKPKGYVTTASDPEHRPTVMDLIRTNERLFPVGRLDYTSEGLLLMTNDGALANALTKASTRVEKTYLVKVSGKPSESGLQQLRHGVMIDRGSQIRKTDDQPRHNEGRVMTAPAKIRMLRDAENPWYELVLIEGRNREIRKMFEEIGHHVEKIRRVGYGPLVLDLEPGKVRELTAEEVEQIQRAAAGKGKKPARRLPGPGKVPKVRRTGSSAAPRKSPGKVGERPRAASGAKRAPASRARRAVKPGAARRNPR
jgi:23S rRNA pseudouridine2605 synthase